MADTFNTIMQGLPPAEIALAEQIAADKTADLTAMDEQIAALTALWTGASEKHTLYDSTRDATIQAAINEIDAMVAQFDIDFPADVPHHTVYGGLFPAPGYANIHKSGVFPNEVLTDDMYVFVIWNSALIPAPVYTGTPGLNAVIDANSTRMLLMGNNIINAFYGTLSEINSLGSALGIKAIERVSVVSTADLYIATYP